MIEKLKNEIKNGNKETMKYILNILKIYNKIINNERCEKIDAENLKNNLTNIGFKFNENNTLEENAEDIVDKAKFITYNIDKIWPVKYNNHNI